MKIKEGDKIPNSEFYYLDESGVPKKISTSELFDKNKTIVIGVPGAFTKVCSAKHLPGYVNNFGAAKKKGITKIICVSVNDPNVMKAWGDSQKVENKIFMAADPYCEFTKSKIEIFTDSQYLKLGITDWINKWVNNNWQTSKKEDVKNKDLWVELYNLNQSLNVKWNWVKAHAGDPINEEVDMLAKEAANLN